MDALLKLLGVADADKAKSVEALKQLVVSTQDDLELANKAIEIYGIK